MGADFSGERARDKVLREMWAESRRESCMSGGEARKEDQSSLNYSHQAAGKITKHHQTGSGCVGSCQEGVVASRLPDLTEARAVWRAQKLETCESLPDADCSVVLGLTVNKARGKEGCEKPGSATFGSTRW